MILGACQSDESREKKRDYSIFNLGITNHLKFK